MVSVAPANIKIPGESHSAQKENTTSNQKPPVSNLHRKLPKTSPCANRDRSPDNLDAQQRFDYMLNKQSVEDVEYGMDEF
jgi:hypothetical protein